MEIKDLAQVSAELQEKKEISDNIDFKMVTFSLGGKDYGVDIMNIKEIAKAEKFTFVPNSASYVRGVYNLRGDIIPVIDLRMFFHLPFSKGQEGGDGLDNMLILHIEDRIYGTIVDKIDKVVGINSSSIQPTHPFFGDINIKYISGVVEHSGDLYIILDVLRIFSLKSGENSVPEPFGYSQGVSASQEAVAQQELRGAGAAGAEMQAAVTVAAPVQEAKIDLGASVMTESLKEDLKFIKDTLPVLSKFTVSPVNENWVDRRFLEWCDIKKPEKQGEKFSVQLKSAQDAAEFLSTFYSPFTEAFWSEDYANEFKSLISALEVKSPIVQVWNLGCGRGLETYSLACLLKLRYANKQIKIWANDNDIFKISDAPNMVFDLGNVPEYCRAFMVKGSSGWSFNPSIKDSIVFEYHDVMNGNSLPKIDLVVARDFISFLPVKGQTDIFAAFNEVLNDNALVVLGKNELMPAGWETAPGGGKGSDLIAYKRML